MEKEETMGPPAGCLFTIFAIFSIIAGFVGGTFIGLNAGLGPDSTGGTIWILSGGMLVGVLSIIARAFTKRRSVLYGISFFLWLSLILLLVDFVFRLRK